MRRLVTAAVLIAASLTLTSCMGLLTPRAAAPTSTPVEASTPTPALECLTVAPEVPAEIAEGSNDTVMTPTGRTAAVASPNSDAYFVAMEFTVPGVDDPQVGVWLVAHVDGPPAPIAAVDGMASEFTVWPHTIRGTELSIAMDGAQDAVDCLN